jgi:hypothetical protein
LPVEPVATGEDDAPEPATFVTETVVGALVGEVGEVTDVASVA